MEKRNSSLMVLALTVGISLAASVMGGSARAGSLRQGSTSSGAEVTGSLPGEVLWGYYETWESRWGFGDSIIRLINPNGAANGNLAGAQTQTVCAMIYVFDEDQEMGECCGCPLSSAQLATFSASKNLTSDWGLSEVEEPNSHSGAYGSVAIVAAAQNVPVSFVPGLSNGQGCGNANAACNGGCDPTNTPGYSVTTASNLLGSITHNQGFEVSTITEVALSDDGGGDPTNLIYLQTQCGAIVGNGTGGGICNCPIE